MVRIFKCSDAAQRVLDGVLENGIAGIAGGRLSTRRLQGHVQKLAEAAGHEHVAAHSTYNHPDAELAYIYDVNLYDSKQALAKVIAAFDFAQANEATD